MELEVRELDDQLLEESAKIVYEGKVTFYDAIPAAIAKLEKIECLAADRGTQFHPLRQRGYPVRLLQ